MSWRENLYYKVLEDIAKNAGITIIYDDVPADNIDGEIWARTDSFTKRIMMPNTDDSFPDAETACLILGHEMGHILSELDSSDIPAERRKNEAVCDLIGVYLYRLVEMTVDSKMEHLGNAIVDGKATEEQIQQFQEWRNNHD